MPLDKFHHIKKNILSRRDKSDEGNWDKKIIRLCNLINEKDCYCTTSSCSGRIVLMIDYDKKQRGLFVFKTHKKTNFKELKKELGKAASLGKDIVFKQESCILHVACRSLDDAQKIVNKAKLAGWKRSGIMTTKRKFMVELLSTEKTELPIIKAGKVLISDDYLKILVKSANEKLNKVWKKINKLKDLL